MNLGALILLIALSLSAVSSEAQSLTVGGAIQQNMQRFDGELSPSRLDGNSFGGMLMGGARLGPLVVRGEASRDWGVRDVQSTTLTLNGVATTIHSELTHDTREVAALAGLAGNLGRVEMSVLGGMSSVWVRRSFSTDAGQFVLISPSAVPIAPVTTTLVDRFATWTAEAAVAVYVSPRLGVIGGVRGQPITLSADLSGRNIRPFAGAVWRFK